MDKMREGWVVEVVNCCGWLPGEHLNVYFNRRLVECIPPGDKLMNYAPSEILSSRAKLENELRKQGMPSEFSARTITYGVFSDEAATI